MECCYFIFMVMVKIFKERSKILKNVVTIQYIILVNTYYDNFFMSAKAV